MANHEEERGAGGDAQDADPAEAIRNIIRATVSASGEPDPETLPHLVRRQLEGQDLSDADVDAYVREVMDEMKNA